MYRGGAASDHCGSVGPVLSRRVLLIGAGALPLSLTGCALVPPGASTPALTPTATPTPDAARDALVAVHEALADAYAAEPASGRTSLLAWALEVTGEQADAVGATVRQVTVAPSPAVTSGPAVTPIPASTAGTETTPSPAATPAPLPTLDALVAALGRAATQYRVRALDPATAQPLVWATMAAWTRALAGSLAMTGAVGEARRDRLPPPVQTVAEAGEAAVRAAEQVLFGVQTAGGAPGLAPDDLDRIRARVVFWRRLRDDLRFASGPSPSPSVTPGQAWFDLPQPVDAAAASALVARLETSALPILGRSLAFGSDPVRARLTDAVAGIAASLPTWGSPLLRWPGWPAA